MVEELKLAIKIDDATIEQSLLKQFANAQKMADKVVLDFKNVNFDDKQIEAKFKEMQKKAGQNPIDLTIGGNTLDMLGKIDKRLTEIFSIGKGKSFIDSSSTVADIGKIVQNTNNQAKAIDKVTNSYKNQAYELASVLKMLAKLDQYGDVPYAEAFSKAVKSGAKSYKNGDDIQFAAKKYGMDEESIKYLRGLSVNLSNAFNYTDTLGLDTANITDVEKLTEYFRELLKEKLEFNNTKLNTSDIEELIKALGIAKKELFDDGTKSGRNIYGDGTLDKYSDLPQIIQYLKQQETQAIATAEAEQKLAEAQKETISNTSNSNNSQIEELKSDIQEVKTELGDVKDRISSIESNGFENVRDDVEKTKESVKELNSELTEMKANLSSTSQESNISSGMKDAFPKTDSTASVEKTTQAIREENNALDETVSKAKQAASELTKTRDIVSQNWYREKGTVVGKDSKGNDITRDADEFSFVERLKNGQLQTVLATYNEETGKWAEQIINVRTAFEQVEKAIISADNRIASLEMAKEKTLASHPWYDTTADDNQIAIERKKRDELQATLNLYGNEKEYVFEIEAATKRIADNQERLNNKKQSQTNLRQAVSDEQFLKDWDAAIAENNKRDAESAKQASKELNEAWNSAIKVNNALDETKSTLSSLSKMPELTSNFSDMESKVSSLNSDLISGKITLSEYKNEVKSVTSEYSKMVSIQQKRDIDEYNSNVKVDNANKLEREKQIWNDLTTSLDRYATLQKRIASNNALSTDVEEAKNLKKHINDLKENDILPKDKLNIVDEKLQQINQTVTDLKAKLKESTLDSLQGSIDKYQKIYNQRRTYSSDFTPSEQYTKNLTVLNTAIKNLVEYRNTLKNVSEVTVEQEAHLKGLVAACEKASDSFKSLSASEKGASQIAIDKLVQRINNDLDENTNYSKRAKLGLRALRDELESANPRNLKEIASEIINIENAEIRAGRAGKSFFDIFKTKGMYSFIGQMQSYLSMYVGFYGMVNAVKKSISTITELDTALVDLKKTTVMNENQLENFYYDSNNVAKQMGVTTKEIIDQASAWSRLGYSTAEAATTMAKLSSQFASISPGMSVDESQSGLVSIMKAWSIDPDQVKSEIMDPINKLGKLLPKHTVMYGAIKYSIVDNYIG